MPNPTIDQMIQSIEQTNGVLASAKVFVEGTAERIQAAIDAALANGATAEQLAPLVDEVNLQQSKADELAAALAANP